MKYFALKEETGLYTTPPDRQTVIDRKVENEEAEKRNGLEIDGPRKNIKLSFISSLSWSCIK